MTTTEARAALIAHDPEVTWCVTEAVWYHSQYKAQSIMYYIFMHVEGKVCQQVSNPDLETAVTEAKEFITISKLPIPPLFSHATN